jgi:NTP pyrophosphatase (non-canonical NTP hydrolase)
LTTLHEPLSRILKDFCHVEWYEVNELSELVNSGSAKFDIHALREQFEDLLANPAGIASQINEISANEFESDEEARNWLAEIYRRVFIS